MQPSGSVSGPYDLPSNKVHMWLNMKMATHKSEQCETCEKGCVDTGFRDVFLCAESLDLFELFSGHAAIVKAFRQGLGKSAVSVTPTCYLD